MLPGRRHEPAVHGVQAEAPPEEKKKAGHCGTAADWPVPHVAPVGHAAPVPAGQKEPAGQAITSDATAVVVAALVVGQKKPAAHGVGAKPAPAMAPDTATDGGELTVTEHGKVLVALHLPLTR